MTDIAGKKLFSEYEVFSEHFSKEKVCLFYNNSTNTQS